MCIFHLNTVFDCPPQVVVVVVVVVAAAAAVGMQIFRPQCDSCKLFVDYFFWLSY
jgi:hypothetical protein